MVAMQGKRISSELSGVLLNIEREHMNSSMDPLLSGSQVGAIRRCLNDSYSPAWVKQVNEGLNAYLARPYAVRNIISTTSPPHLIVAFFDTKLNKKLRFGFLNYEKFWEEPSWLDLFQSNTIAARTLTCCDAMTEYRTVALFPEQWLTDPDNPQFKEQITSGAIASSDTLPRDLSEHCDAPTIYLFDKFVERHVKYSQPTLRHFVSGDSLPELRKYLFESSGEAKIYWLQARWGFLHEGSHRQGACPYLDIGRLIKYSRMGGAFEECRADFRGLAKLIRRWPSDLSIEFLQFVFFERLARFPVQRIARENEPGIDEIKLDFDSIASIGLYRDAEKFGCIRYENGVLVIDPSWIDFVCLTADKLSAFDEILAVEAAKLDPSNVDTDSVKQTQQLIADFVTQWAGYKDGFVPIPKFYDDAARYFNPTPLPKVQ